MNSISFFTKAVPCWTLFKVHSSILSVPNCYLQCICTVSSFKSDHICSNQDTDKTNHSIETSNQFGLLRKPLEKNFKDKCYSSPNSTVQNKKRVIKVKKSHNDESDVFGNLSESKPFWYSDFTEEPKRDNDLSDDSVILKNFGKTQRCPEKYFEQMKQYVKEKKIKDALDLFVKMRRQFVAPAKIHFTYMIGVCGRIGYTEMAFKLLRQMTDRSFKPSSATLTGLFNACAESPFPEYGLKKAHHLKEKIQTKSWLVTQPTYHAMIKAFGKCGDLATAFKIVDEMVKADIKISTETYNFLITSCISNKEAGFTYAIEVIRKMKSKKCVPDIFTYNLLLRCARDCDIGPEEISCLLLQHWSNFSKRPYGFITKEELIKEPVLKLTSETNNASEPILKLTSETNDILSKPLDCGQNEYYDLKDRNKTFTNNESSQEIKVTSNKSTSLQNFSLSATNLLSPRPISGPEILEIVNIKTPNDRLALIGGMKGILQSMKDTNVKPDKKTFAILLECLPDNIEAEENLLTTLDSYTVKLDICFFNILIKRRNFRRETEAARKVLLLLNKYDLTPDIMTFGALVLGCRTFHQACIFIEDMKKFNLSPNIEIIGSLARQASMILDFPYMKYVLKYMENENIKPDEKLLTTLEKSLSDARKNIILMEQGKEFNKFYDKKDLKTDFKEFSNFYEKWLKRMKFESEKHPWLQYKTEIIDKVKEENFVLSNNC